LESEVIAVPIGLPSSPNPFSQRVEGEPDSKSLSPGKEQTSVIPAKAGIQASRMALTERLLMDAHFHGHDEILLFALKLFALKNVMAARMFFAKST